MKRWDNLKYWVLLLLFIWYYHHHIHIYIYIFIYTYIYDNMYIYISICRFLFCQRCENSKCYIYSGGKFLCRSLEAVIFCFLVSFSEVYSLFNIQSYFKLVKKFIQQIWVSFLFSSKYVKGIHDNIHSRSTLYFILFTDVWWKIHDFQFQAVHTQRYFSNISRHWIHNSSSEQSVKLFLSFFLSFFLFHFQQGSNKT